MNIKQASCPMTNPNLPPLQGDENEDTLANESQQTRPHAPLNVDKTEANAVHKTEMIRKAAPPPTGQHVIPVAGQQHKMPPPGYKPRPPRRKSVEDSALYLPWWSIALMLVGVIIVAFAVVGGVILLGSSGIFVAEPTPIIVIVTANPNAPVFNQPSPQPSSVQIISGGNNTGNLALEGPTLAPIVLTPTPAAINVGSRVVVEGVDADTLNVRSSASLNESTILFRAEEGEFFNVIEGPAQSDGFTWWRIQDPNDVNRAGWAVGNFLTVVPQ
jgi:hypothetical protein